MKVGLLHFELRIDDARSLKDKRRVVRSLRDRLHRDHLVSVAEVGANDVWNVAQMGVAVVAGDTARVGDVLDRITRKLESLHDARLDHIERDIFDPFDLPSGDPLWTPDERRDDAETPSQDAEDAA